jgi:hypothetical protein
LLADLQVSLGHIYLQLARPDDAIPALQTAQRLLARTQHRRFLLAIHEGLATAYLRQGQHAKAETELQSSLALAEQARRSINEVRNRNAFLGSRLNVYQTMVSFQYYAKQSASAAYDYAQIYRNRELLNALDEHATFRWERQQATLEYPGSVNPLTLPQVQRALPADAQLIEYAITEQGLLIWLITGERCIPASVPVAPARLRQMVVAYLSELYARREVAALNQRAADLYGLLIDPVAAHLDKRRTLVIIPDGILSALPFSALPCPSSCRYLLEDYTIITNPSASVFVRTLALGRAKKSASFASLLVLSNPRFDRKVYPLLRSLPHSEQEAARLKPLYPVFSHLNRQQAAKRPLLERLDSYEDTDPPDGWAN